MTVLQAASTNISEPERPQTMVQSYKYTQEFAPTTDDGQRTGPQFQEPEEDEVEEVDEVVKEDMRKLEDSFPGIAGRFRLVNRIGEGTFSTVYKAEDLNYDIYRNDWDMFKDDHSDDWGDHPSKRRRVDEEGGRSVPGKHKKRYVALKKIYVTSSPLRIQNELELLHDLRGCRSVCPLITAFRYHDQVVAVLPFFPHTDFRLQYRTFMVADMRHYFRSLFTALHSVHKHDILHRDIKPTNFLYNPDLREGVLVDFGLAEREGSEYTGTCLCTNASYMRKTRYTQSYHYNNCSSGLAVGYPKSDSRPSRRANRAGTRGFRAPEVLFKCTSQTTKIDMWSAGVILLTLLGRRFPFFNSADDVDALIEMASIFGTRRMKNAAAMHGQVFETNIPTIGEKGYSWEKLVKWSSCVEELTESEKQATRLLAGLMELDPSKRLSAKEAMQHEFFTSPIDHDVEWGGPEDSADSGREDEGDKAGDEDDDDDDEVDMV
ncbi:kinase-like domain-containing protein [Aspergillus unguis]